MNYTGYYNYVEVDGERLFTTVMLPERDGKFPAVVLRVPYVDELEDKDPRDIVSGYIDEFKSFLEHGYAVVYQHCRGRGKSSGDFIPYINERKDGLALFDFIRGEAFYNGEIFLWGISYSASAQYLTAPFADDIKGAVLEVQTCERYFGNYKNGFLKVGGNWYVNNYKKKSKKSWNYTPESYNTLPLLDLPKAMFGEEPEAFMTMLKHPDYDDEIWDTEIMGSYAKSAIKTADIPILFSGGFYDIYTGAMFKMWNDVGESLRAKSAFIVSPYDHDENWKTDTGVYSFPKGKRTEKFGDDYVAKWFDFARGKCEPLAELGKVTYYKMFKNVWESDDFKDAPNEKKITLGKDSVTYLYNPYNPPLFNAINSFQEEANRRYDIVTLYTDEFLEDALIKGRIRAKLRVKTDAEDTAFFIRLSIEKDGGDYGLREDIRQISAQYKDYKPGTEVDLDFIFDEHAFKVQQGERLRIDISSANAKQYFRHTNTLGLYCEQKTAKLANNTVVLDKSYIILPIE